MDKAVDDISAQNIPEQAIGAIVGVSGPVACACWAGLSGPCIGRLWAAT